jgi:hypothetical protein
LLLVLAGVGTWVVMSATMANASELTGPPDSAGKSAHCNVLVATPSGTSIVQPGEFIFFNLACQTGFEMSSDSGYVFMFAVNGEFDGYGVESGEPYQPNSKRFRGGPIGKQIVRSGEWTLTALQLKQSDGTYLDTPNVGYDVAFTSDTTAQPEFPCDNWPGGSSGTCATTPPPSSETPEEETSHMFAWLGIVSCFALGLINGQLVLR